MNEKAKKVSLNRSRGRSAEKKIADLMNGVRMGIFGGEDVAHSRFSIEVKDRAAFCAEAWMKQAEKHAKKQRVPLVIVHKRGTHFENSFVILRAKDFKHVIGANSEEPK